MANVLIIEDERLLAENMRDKLERDARHRVKLAHSCNDALQIVGEFTPHVSILDLRLPDGDGLDLVPKLKAASPESNIIVVTAHGNEQIAVEAMKAGAYEYMTKPLRLGELGLVVDRAAAHVTVCDNLRVIRRQNEANSGLDRIIGASKDIQQVKRSIQRLTETDALRMTSPPTVLITGETGTGKDLAARAIHYHGPRRQMPFIHVNCTAIPESLFETELFGHIRGAFTNAASAKRGLFEVAEGGTLFLDEIGHVKLDIQAKLLSAIELREIRPVGGTESRPVNVHVIAATNRNLEAAVTANEFRRDLYHRLRVVEMPMPPLRDRTEDIPLLVGHFMTMHARSFGVAEKTVSDDALEKLVHHRWPGNVRELSHLIENCLLQLDDEVITGRNVPLIVDRSHHEVRIEGPGGQIIYLDFAGACPTLEDVERSVMLAAYEYTGGNMTGAARLLGITREAFRYRMNRSQEKAR